MMLAPIPDNVIVSALEEWRLMPARCPPKQKMEKIYGKRLYLCMGRFCADFHSPEIGDINRTFIDKEYKMRFIDAVIANWRTKRSQMSERPLSTCVVDSWVA